MSADDVLDKFARRGQGAQRAVDEVIDQVGPAPLTLGGVAVGALVEELWIAVRPVPHIALHWYGEIRNARNDLVMCSGPHRDLRIAFEAALEQLQIYRRAR